MKKISTTQIEALLKVLYGTNIPASQFDAVRKMLTELPDTELTKPKKK